MCSSGIRSGNNNNNSSSSVVFIYGRLFGVISPANTPDSWLVLSRSETRSDPKKVLTKPVFHHPETIHQTRCKALGWRRGTKCHGRGKKIRECKCGLPCLLSPLCPWWWWRREWHREEWGQSWQGSKHRPSLSEILEGLAHIMPYGSWIKEGWREGTGSPLLGESKDTPLAAQGSMRHDWGQRSLPGLWLGTWRSLRRGAQVLEWASPNEAAGASSRQAQRAWGQPTQKQVGTEFAKRHCWHPPGGTTGTVHAQNQKKSTVDCHETNPQKESRLSTPYHNMAQSSGKGTEMTSPWNEEAAPFAYFTLLLLNLHPWTRSCWALRAKKLSF